MSDTQPKLKALPMPKTEKSEKTKQPLDTNKIALILAVLMGIFGGGSYAVTPWATTQGLSALADKVDQEIKDRKEEGKREARQLKLIAEKVGAEVVLPEPTSEATE